MRVVSFAAVKRMSFVGCRKCGNGLVSGCESVWCRPMGRCRLLEGLRGPLGIYPGGRAGQKIPVLIHHCTSRRVPLQILFLVSGPGVGERSLRVSVTLRVSVPA